MKYNIIVSINNHNIIGEKNKLIIQSKQDLQYFYRITTGKYPEGDKNIVIMGYNTWLSIPSDKKPLKNRINIILTISHEDKINQSDTIKVFNSLQQAFHWSSENSNGKVFVIGGTTIFNECCKDEFFDDLDLLYVTRFNNDYQRNYNTHNFPLQLFHNKQLIQKSEVLNEVCQRPHLKDHLSMNKYIRNPEEINSIDFTFNIYQNKNNSNQNELQYIELLNKILNKGIETESRNSKVLSLFGEKMEFNLNEGFPLLTTKKMGYKTILRELLWFIRGSTSNKELQDKNVHIWDQNSTREFLDSRGLSYEEGDLGPVYGFQWRHFGAEYESCYSDYSDKGIDQLKNIIELIKNDPTSRRILLNSWNASDIDKMALPPCHVMCQFNVNLRDKTLNCQLYQRSGDMFLGVPFNIASYSFLTCILAKITGYKPGKLIHILGDTHIYENHINAVKEQIKRVPYQFPELILSDELSDIDNLKEEYFTIQNYLSYPKITAPMIA